MLNAQAHGAVSRWSVPGEHPETKAGIAGAAARWNANDKKSLASFVSATAATIGKNERMVECMVQREQVLARSRSPKLS